jgi:myosin heavy subunit
MNENQIHDFYHLGGTSLLAPGGHQQQQQQPQHHQQQQQQQQQPIADLLGLSSETTDTVIPTSPQQQPQQSHFNNTDFTSTQASTQASLQSSIQQESTRNQLAQSQYHNESQAVQELERQIASQKEALAKIKQEAEEAEKELAAEKEKKEKLTKELQMYRQETKHFSTRAENAQEETKQVKKEIEELENSRKAATMSPLQSAASPTFNNTSASPTASHDDFFTLSSATPSLFAKVQDASSTPASLPQAMSPSSSSQKSYDPFAGFKVHQEKKGSPTLSAASLNHLKEETEKKKSVGSPNVDISDIESKFPDLSTMEQNFQMPTSPSLSTTSQKKPEPISSPKSIVFASAAGKNDDSLFKPSKDNIFGLVDKPKTSDVFPEKPTTASSSKYGFDLSAFEPSTSTQSGNNMSVKDELSSLFGGSQTEEKPAPNFSDAFSSEKPAEKPTSNGFDDIFGAPAATNKSNSFEDIFFQK